MGGRLATIDMGRKVGAAVPPSVWELGPHLTQCRLDQDLYLCDFDMRRLRRTLTYLLTVPSGILIHPAVWPQYTDVTDRQTGQTTVR